MNATSLYTVAQVRQLERAAIDAGTPSYVLMQRAAAGAFACLRRRWPQARRIVVLCGSGNNGGDGYLVAKLAREAGLTVSVLALQACRAGSDAAQACADWQDCYGSVSDANTQLPDADVYVDALFGTGLTRPAEGVAHQLIDQLNATRRSVLALDVPSGLNADTGKMLGNAVRADATVSFVAHKRGLFTGDAFDVCGEVTVDYLGLPDALYTNSVADAQLLDAGEMAGWLPPRPRNAHKGLYGHVLAIGGDSGMGGAIRLTSEAALRVGAGLVSVATRADHVGALNASRPELMAHGVEGPQELDMLIPQASVIAIGPGLGQRAWGHGLWHSALRAGKPMVLDADGLNLLARESVPLSEQTVLTPHPGEARRLLGCDSAAIADDRFAAVRALAKRYRSCVVLKGAGSLIANAQGDVAVCPWGNPGMSSGGMGDLLTGVIAGLLAQGLDAWSAARLGVALHAQAGDLAARNGQAGMLASDLFTPLCELRNGLVRA